MSIPELDLNKYEGPDTDHLAFMIDEANPERVAARQQQKREDVKTRKSARQEIISTTASAVEEYPDPKLPNSTLPVRVTRKGQSLTLRLQRHEGVKPHESVWDSSVTTTVTTSIIGEYPGEKQEVLFEISEKSVKGESKRGEGPFAFTISPVAWNRDGGVATTEQYRQALGAVRVITRQLPRQHPGKAAR
jgi:hypothetical protein